MRRTLSLIIFVVALAGLVSACGGGDDAPESGLSSSSDATDRGSGHDEMDESEMDDDHMDDGGREHAANTPVAPGARTIELSGRSFAFDPPEITVRAGADVAIVLSATDIEHDFTVDGLDAHVSADAGETTEGGLRADEPGTYTYYCSVEGHREAGMEGTLIVEPA